MMTQAQVKEAMLAGPLGELNAPDRYDLLLAILNGENTEEQEAVLVYARKLRKEDKTVARLWPKERE